MNKVLICGDPHVGIRDPTVANAAREAFDNFLGTALDLGITSVAHTGDFCDAPLSAPNLTTNCFYRLRYSLDAVRNRLHFTECPVGNHDIPKEFNSGYVPAWNNLIAGYAPSLTYVFTLDFEPQGKKQLIVNVKKKLKQLVSPYGNVSHLLVLGHCHWSQGRFNMRSAPLHENHLTPELKTLIENTAENQGYKSCTFVLGHDHKPADYPEDNVYVIGSPTPFTFGDSDPRRFIEFNTETGEVRFHPSTVGLKVIKGEELDLDWIEPSTAVEFTGTPNRDVLKKLSQKHVKYRVLKSEKVEIEVPEGTDFVNSYKQFENDESIRDYNLDLLEEMK